jgi:hypothetical protein
METSTRKKIMVTLSEVQYKNLESAKELGESDSEKLRNAFLIYHNLRDLLQVINKLKE